MACAPFPLNLPGGQRRVQSVLGQVPPHRTGLASGAAARTAPRAVRAQQPAQRPRHSIPVLLEKHAFRAERARDSPPRCACTLARGWDERGLGRHHVILLSDIPRRISDPYTWVLMQQGNRTLEHTHAALGVEGSWQQRQVQAASTCTCATVRCMKDVANAPVR